MSEDSAFRSVEAGLRGGDEEAARRVFERFARRLIGLARGRLDERLRGKLDAEDVVQSVFRSFFRRQAEAPFDLGGWDGLWSLLTVITLRKCGYWRDHYRTLRRDVQREARPAPTEEPDGWEAINRDPTPLEAAQLAETVEQLFRGMDDNNCRILELSLQGHKATEIAPQVGVTERSVYRLLDRVRARLERQATADDAP